MSILFPGLARKSELPVEIPEPDHDVRFRRPDLVDLLGDGQGLRIRPPPFQRFDVIHEKLDGPVFLSQLEAQVSDDISDRDILAGSVQELLIFGDRFLDSSRLDKLARPFGDFGAVGSFNSHGFRRASVGIVD